MTLLMREASFSVTYLGSDELPLPTPWEGHGSFTTRGDVLTSFEFSFNGAYWALDDTLGLCECTQEHLRIPLIGDDFIFWGFGHGEHEAVFTLWIDMAPHWTAIGSTPSEIQLEVLSWGEHPVSAPEAFSLLFLGLLVLPIFSRRFLKWH